MYKAKFIQDAVLNLAQEHVMFFFFLGPTQGLGEGSTLDITTFQAM